MATGLGSRAAAAAGRGVGRGAVECQQRTLVALPDAMLSEVMGEQFFSLLLLTAVVPAAKEDML